jgi:hypothetical protein
MTLEEFFAVVAARGPDNQYHMFTDLGNRTFTVDSVEGLVEIFRKEMARNPSMNRWFSPAGYFPKTNEEDLTGRKQVYVKSIRTFWADIDVSPDLSKKTAVFKTKTEAWAACRSMCEATGLPLPLLVDSGNGLHAYWPLSEEITKPRWDQIAAKFFAICLKYGAGVDSTRAKDSASLLRIPGSINVGKDYDNKTNISCVIKRDKYTAITAQQFEDLLTPHLPEGFNLPAIKYKNADAFNSDLVAHHESLLKYSAEKVAEGCKHVAKMRDTQGDIPRETWRGVLGIIKHCVEGVELAVKWSERRAETGHSNTNTEDVYESWNAKPATCEFFQRDDPKACDGCNFKDKIHSPISLGGMAPEPPKQVESVVDGEPIKFDVPPPPSTAYGYNVAKNETVRYVRDKDGILHDIAFAPILFYATNRIKSDEGFFEIALRAHMPRGGIRDMRIPTSTLSSSSKLLEVLASQEIITTSQRGAPEMLTAYLKDSLTKLMQEADEINTYSTFGWTDDMQSFLLGDRLFHRDGTISKVLLSNTAASFARKTFFSPRGTVEGYSDAINEVYNRPGFEPMQYAIASAFGSVLTPMCEESYNGLVCVLSSPKSGGGKSTACKAALYAFGNGGNQGGMFLGGDKETGATGNGRWMAVAMLKNLPCLFDEITNMEPKEYSQMAYTVAQGHPKVRMRSTGKGVVLEERMNWRMAPLATANKDVHFALTDLRDTSEAEAVRVVQIRIDRYNVPKLDPLAVESAMAQLAQNAGAAGEKFIQHIVKNYDSISEQFRLNLETIAPRIPDQKFRFYRNHAACTLTALQVCNDLGILNFDFGVMVEFCVDLMVQLSKEIDSVNNISPEEAVNKMVAHLTPRILHTKEFRDARDKAGSEEPPRIYGTVAGRYVEGLTVDDPYAGHLYIALSEFKKWCQEKNVDHEVVVEYLRDKGSLLCLGDKITLTRGTTLPPAQQRVIGIHTGRLLGLPIGSPKLVSGKVISVDKAA